ncbi:hypothetical protein FB380_002655 [Modestobacter marinus]|uniref:Uncharacterized protein n=1 Tax=Modestobacter marinus TaxID=477641 RepID=A0A846LXS1_9ACTN|nr:hypothetical protein [Modestobacter marinus]
MSGSPGRRLQDGLTAVVPGLAVRSGTPPVAAALPATRV